MVATQVAHIEESFLNQRIVLAIGLLLAAVLASLGVLFIISEVAVDAQAVESFSDAMVVDARSAIFRPGGAVIE